MTNRFPRRAIVCALLATTALVASPGLAVTPAGTPPVHQNVDSNGVDMALGNFTFETPTLSIGPASPHGLSYNRTNLGDGWRENVAATIAQDANGYILVSAGGTSDRFQVSGSSYVNTEGNGATLTFDGAVYTYTNRNGTVAIFDEANGDYDRYVADIGWIRDVTFPDGVKWTYQYLGQNYCPTNPDPGDPCYLPEARSVRLQAVNSNTGYQLKFTYASDTLNVLDDLSAWQQLANVRAINSGTDYCDPIANSCSFTKSWPSIAISRTLIGSNWDETETDATGAVTHYTIDSSERLTGVKLPGSSADNIDVTYGTDGRVSQVTRAGVTYNYAWSDAGNVRTMTRTDPLSHTLSAVSAIDTSLVSNVTDENGKTTSYLYDSSFRPTRVTKPEGNYTQYTYDGRGNVTERRAVAKSGSGLADIVLTAGYDATCTNPKTCNEPNWTKDARSNQTDYTYDSTHGGVLTVTRPAPSTGAVRPQTRISYSGLQAYYKQSSGGSPAAGGTIYLPSTISACQTLSSCSAGSDETKTTIAYGPQVAGTANNLLPVSSSSGAGDNSLTATTAFAYDLFGNQVTVDGPLSGTADTSMARYDADRRLIGEVDPDPDGAGALKMRALRITYRGDGQISKEELGTVTDQSDSAWANFATAQQIDVGFDANARPVTSKLSASGTNYAMTQAGYDTLGRLNCSAIRMNPAIYSSLPSDACSLGTQGSYGPDQITKVGYDADSRPITATAAYGTADQAVERTLAYSDNGKVISLIDGENNKTTFVYDGFDRLSQVQYPNPAKGNGGSNSADYEQLTYDANSMVTQVRVRNGATIVLNRDKLSRISHKGGSAIADRDFTYDNLDRMLTAKFSTGGQGITNSYDALSRLTSTSSDMGGTAHALTYSYDLAGNRTQMNWWDGFYVNYDRLVTGEATKVRENGAVSGVGVLATYAYDDLRRATSVTFGNGAVQALSYDPVSRLSQITNDLSGTTNDLTATFGYSPASQIASTTRTGDSYAYTGNANTNTAYTSNGLNQQVNIGGSTATWDSNGNLAIEPQSGKTYVHNAENLLTSSSGGTSTSLGYDPLNRLDTYNPGSVRRFVYDGAEAVAELDSTGAIQNRYVRGDGADELLVDYSGSGTTSRRFTSADERGSIISLTDSGGSLVGIDRYDEYGKPQSTNIGRFQYTGQAWLSEANVDYYKARTYLPHLGIFGETDPAGYADSANLYAYVLNDPVNGMDPMGLQSEPATDSQYVKPYNPGDDIIITANVRSKPLDSIDAQVLQSSMLGANGTVGEENAADNSPAIYVVGQRRTDTTTIYRLASVRYYGASFCPNPTWSDPSFFYPNGRITSGRSGTPADAIRDLNTLASLNDVTPLSSVPISDTRLSIALSAPIPIGLGGGWYGWHNPVTDFVSIYNGGLGFRDKRHAAETVLDIPSGFYLPNGGQLTAPESCHYH